MLEYRQAWAPRDFEQAKTLFQQHATSLGIDLCFQNFDREMQQIHIQCNQPTGALILAYDGELPIGCVGVRLLEKDICELKRMYVQPEYRKLKVGQQLLEKALAKARQLGHRKIRFDTLHEMVAAQKSYLANGFYETSPYRFNPSPHTVFMEKIL